VPNSRPTANRLTHEQVKSVCPGTEKVRECPLCGGKLSLYGTDGILCCNPQPCDPTAVAAKIHELRDAKKARPSTKSDWTGLTVAEYCEAKHLPTTWLRLHYTADLRDNPTPMERIYKGKPVVDFAYMDQDRKVIFTRFRESMNSRPYSESGSKMSIPYGLWLWTNKPDASGNWPRAVVVCEGESDQQSLTLYGVPALGIPGVNNWKPDWANLPVLRYAERIFVVQEPAKEGKPDVGKKFVETVAASFPAGKVAPLNLAAHTASSAKDPSDLHINVELAKDFEEPFLKQLVTTTARNVLSAARRIQSVLASDVEMDLTRWLWYDHIPVGDVTVFAGMPAKGKSTAAIDVVARLTTGKDFPGSVRQVEACEVAILASEDNPKTTTVPRLRAAAADVGKVHLIQGTYDGKQEWEIGLDKDLDRLREFLRDHPQIKLIVMDPVTSYIGDVDPNKPKEVRPFLNKLKKFAEEMGVSLLLIMHLSKNPDVSALHRVGGAATWIEVPRSVWFFDVKQQEEGSTAPPSYVMVNGKLNIVADERKKSLEYTFAGVDVEIKGVLQNMGTIRWGEESSITLEQQYTRTREKPGPEPKKVEAAIDWLQNYLADGEKFATDVFRDAEQADHADNTLRKAQSKLRIKPEREFANKGRWVWKLPAADGPDTQDQSI
jgi:putative DNA primase/helicase